MKALHILYQSLPNISGSSIRSRDILNNQFKIGIEPIVITSPFQNPKTNGKSFEVIDGNGIKEALLVEENERFWRADPSDGLRPLKSIRN